MMSRATFIVSLILTTTISIGGEEVQVENVMTGEVRKAGPIQKESKDKFRLTDYIFLNKQPHTMSEILGKLNNADLRFVKNNSDVEMDLGSFVGENSREPFQIKSGEGFMNLEQLQTALNADHLDYLAPLTVHINNSTFTLPEILEIYGKEYKGRITINYQNGFEEVFLDGRSISVDEALQLTAFDKNQLYDHTVLQLNSVPTDFYSVLNLVRYISNIQIGVDGTVIMGVDDFLQKFPTGFQGKILFYENGKPITPSAVIEKTWSYTLNHRFKSDKLVIEPWKVLDSLQNVPNLEVWSPELKLRLNAKDALDQLKSVRMLQFFQDGVLLSVPQLFSMLDTVGNTVFNNMELLDALEGVEIEVNGIRSPVEDFRLANKGKVEFKVIKNGVTLTLDQLYNLAGGQTREITYEFILEEIVNQNVPALILYEGAKYNPKEFLDTYKGKVPKFTIELGGEVLDYDAILMLLKMKSPLRKIKFKGFPDVTIEGHVYKPLEFLEKLVKLNPNYVLILHEGKFYHPSNFLKIYRENPRAKFAVIKGTQIISPHKIGAVIPFQTGFQNFVEKGVTYTPFQVLEKALLQHYDFDVIFGGHKYTIPDFLKLKNKTNNFGLMLNGDEISPNDVPYMIDWDMPIKNVQRKGLEVSGNLKPNLIITNDAELNNTEHISLTKTTTITVPIAEDDYTTEPITSSHYEATTPAPSFRKTLIEMYEPPGRDIPRSQQSETPKPEAKPYVQEDDQGPTTRKPVRAYDEYIVPITPPTLPASPTKCNCLRKVCPQQTPGMIGDENQCQQINQKNRFCDPYNALMDISSCAFVKNILIPTLLQRLQSAPSCQRPRLCPPRLRIPPCPRPRLQLPGLPCLQGGGSRPFLQQTGEVPANNFYRRKRSNLQPSFLPTKKEISRVIPSL